MHTRHRFFLLAASSALLFTACATTPAPQPEPVPDAQSDAIPSPDKPFIVQYRDRVINLEPYVQGFPYSYFQPFLEDGFMLYFELTQEGNILRHLDLTETGEVDLRAGRQVNAIDWSTRNWWGGELHRPSGKFIFRGDERNDERINLYALDLDTGAVEALTDHDYIYGVGLSEDHSLLAYVARHGTAEPFNSCLYLRSMHDQAEEDRQILCDEAGADRFTWTGIEFSPDNDRVIVRVQHDGDRNRTNLAAIALEQEEPAWNFLLERGERHFRLGTLRYTFDAEGITYLSAKSGFDNLYRYDFATGTGRALTEYRDEMASAVMLRDEERPSLMVVLRRPYESEIHLLDPETGAILHQETSAYSLRLADYDGAEMVFSMSSVASPFRMEKVDVLWQEGAPSLKRSLIARLPEELAEQIIHCDVERISFPTFDVDVDDAPRLLHAYLLTPKDAPEPDKRLVRITAFYGGGNFFSTGHQIMCEAGIATLSPSPRGSSGFGSKFAALNDGDLGGDEIIDIFYAARWLEANRGYTSHQIGVHGGSHGGYATMRALTFPLHTNDRHESYPFGFGMSHAGFSDIIRFYETSNIPDWVILEAGDPAREADKLHDRSPINHIELLTAPLLLTHGENDSRVPVEESRSFARRAAELDRPVVYVEFEGQGHGIDGLDNTLRYYQAMFEFLTDYVDPNL